VYWAGGILPPMVYVGNVINFIGRFVTMNDGHVFYVQEAVPFEGNFSKIIEPVRQYLWAHCPDPREWALHDRLDLLNIKDYNAPIGE
jgi:hypothetical protein